MSWLTIFNFQFTKNFQFSIFRLAAANVWKLKIVNLLKIENCYLKIKKMSIYHV